MLLKNVKGVNEEACDTLRKNNIKFAEDLAAANCFYIEELGLSSDMVAEALRHINHGKEHINHRNMGYECDFCGETFPQRRSSRALERHKNIVCDENEQSDFE